MCGIVGALSSGGSVLDGLLDGLRKLEYRGYDSSGVALAEGDALVIRKKVGRLAELETLLTQDPLGPASAGIGHTRWATHGKPSDANAHPHTDGERRVAVVHNGIIENEQRLRRELEELGLSPRSDTDTELLALLVGTELERGATLVEAVRRTLRRAEGYYAVAFLLPGSAGADAQIVCARKGPPLALAVTKDAAFLASDVLALVDHSRDVIFLEDGDVALLGAGSVTITDVDGEPLERTVQHVDWESGDANKEGFEHFMLKEIHEQPDVVARTAAGRIDLEHGDVVFEGSGWSDGDLASVERLLITACGTALHAGLITQYFVEGLARVPVDVDFASEFRYRNPVVRPNTLALAFSQSGETADTLAALRLARSRDARTAVICNSAGSTMVRECEATLLTHAGPEIGVASTKAFTAQLVAGYLLALRLGRAQGSLSPADCTERLEELTLLRGYQESLLADHSVADVRAVAERHQNAKGFLFLGRGVNYPIALEGALKLKEISYMHAEGYPAGEMKHGPIALIEPGMSIVVLASRGAVAEKVRSNIEQVKARGGSVICVGSDPEAQDKADEVIPVPDTSEWLSPMVNVLPLQLLSYFIAQLRGCDIDKPRNLAKSVTVE